MKKCIICNSKERKYKCPKCEIPYCSVQCFQVHKDSNSCTQEAKSIHNQSDVDQGEIHGEKERYQFPTEHTVPIEKLKLLGKNGNIKKLLENPHLRKILEALHKTKHVNHAMNMVMLEPIFVEFAVECLKCVEPNDEMRSELENEHVTEFIQQIKQLVDQA